MSNSSSDMTEGTLRQRRNLLITSIILIFYSTGDVKLGSQLSILGASIVIGNPDSLIYFLSVAHIYYLYRYWQYAVADPFYISEKERYKRLKKAKLDSHLKQRILDESGVGTARGFNLSDFEMINGVVKGYVLEAGFEDNEVKYHVDFFEPMLTKRIHWRIAYQVYFKGKLITDFILPLVLAAWAVGHIVYFILSGLGFI